MVLQILEAILEQYPNFTENENEVKSDNQYKNISSTCLQNGWR